MRIVDIRERAVPLKSNIANSSARSVRNERQPAPSRWQVATPRHPTLEVSM